MLPSSVPLLGTLSSVSARSVRHFPLRPMPRSASPGHFTDWVAWKKPTPSMPS